MKNIKQWRQKARDAKRGLIDLSEKEPKGKQPKKKEKEL